MFHSSFPKQVLLATTCYPLGGGDSVCCEHRVIGLNPGAVQINLEDSGDKTTP
jgi:hypothetical protein